MKELAQRIERVGLVANADKLNCREAVQSAAAQMAEAGRTVLSDKATADLAGLKSASIRDADRLAQEVDLLLVFGGDGTMLAVGGGDGLTTLWDLRHGRRARVITGHGSNVISVSFSPDGRTLIVVPEGRIPGGAYPLRRGDTMSGTARCPYARWPHGVYFAPVLMLITVLYWPVVPSMVMTWYNDPNYSHGFIVPFVLQLGYFVSPVGYSSNIVPTQWRALYSLNPLAGLIEGFRWAVCGGSAFPLGQALTAIALVALLLDLTLRRESRFTLDDVMRALWQRYGRAGTPAPEGALETVADLAGDWMLTHL